MTQPRKFTANAVTPRIPIDAFSKPLEGTPTKPNPNMDRITPQEWAGKKPYLRTPEIKAAEKPEQTSRVTRMDAKPEYRKETPKIPKQFPKFRLEVDMNAGEMVYEKEIVVSGVEGQTAASIANALLNDRNLRIKEIRITFDGLIAKED